MSEIVLLSSQPPGWHPAWEENVYDQRRHLNLYPYHAVVGFIFRHFGQVKNRASVRILELGCGAGNNLWFAAREGFSVAGIDGSPTAIEFARNRFASEQLTGDLRVGDFTVLPWHNNTFDIVLDRNALTHNRRGIIAAALREAVRVLIPTGRLLSIVYSNHHSEKQYGRHLGDNSYDNFTGGYFAGLGTTFFASRRDIDNLFDFPLKVVGLSHNREEKIIGADKLVNAFWQVECVKEHGH
ncbi:MAG TPA: class I SAM-dependent methyltransferase [Anaerolineae bacterium]|nr:class I SAM-dependent methyltransferase [Anaerolineae bacterium]HMR65459.1 class I SAM-dependent methyltransferase [Anaerolineae bacterium]